MKEFSRALWGARKPTHTPQRLGQLHGVAIHYTGSNADEQANHANCAGRVRAIQTFHMSPTPSDPTKPWNDIAYNYLVCKHGFIFEGRGRGVRSAAQGTNDGNDHYLAVCFLGDDTAGRDDVTLAGRLALVRLVARELQAGTVRAPVGGQLVLPHSAFHSTACPGNDLRELCAQLSAALLP